MVLSRARAHAHARAHVPYGLQAPHTCQDDPKQDVTRSKLNASDFLLTLTTISQVSLVILLLVNQYISNIISPSQWQGSLNQVLGATQYYLVLWFLWLPLSWPSVCRIALDCFSWCVLHRVEGWN